MIRFKTSHVFLVIVFTLVIYLYPKEFPDITERCSRIWNYNDRLRDAQNVKEGAPTSYSYSTTIKLNPVIQTTEKSTVEEVKYYARRNISSFSETDGFVRHCITGEVLGVVPNVTKTIKFALTDKELVESSKNRTKSFQKVFRDRAWGKDWEEKYDGLDVSGRGSTLYWAQDVIGVLHKVINDIKTLKGGDYKVKLLDVPCGDFAWMNRFLSTRDDIEYTGMDIVPELIGHHNGKYKNKDWTFINRDVVIMDTLGGFDIILCRMMLQHLFTSDIKRVLKLFSKTSGGLLLTTNFYEKRSNEELELNTLDNPGRFREVNLEIPPFSLPPPLCVARDGMPGEISSPNIFLGVWKLPLRRVRRCRHVQSFEVKLFNANFYSCTKWA